MNHNDSNDGKITYFLPPDRLLLRLLLPNTVLNQTTSPSLHHFHHHNPSIRNAASTRSRSESRPPKDNSAKPSSKPPRRLFPRGAIAARDGVSGVHDLFKRTGVGAR